MALLGAFILGYFLGAGTIVLAMYGVSLLIKPSVSPFKLAPVKKEPTKGSVVDLTEQREDPLSSLLR